MPSQDSPSVVNYPTMTRRTSSSQSLSHASPPRALPSTSHKASTHKPHKAFTTNHGRLGHTRNSSYGKNLNKLTKLNGTHGSDDAGIPRSHSRTKLQTPSTSPSSKDLRRNSSNVSLPRVSSKTSVKRNSSNISLKRNGSSATQLGKNGRPMTPLRNTHPLGKSKHHGASKETVSFSVGSDEQDEDWTEESNSQSPSTTRQSSDGARTRQGTPPNEQPVTRGNSALPDSPPESLDSESSTEVHVQPPQHRQDNLYSTRQPSRAPDADTVTSRLLSQYASYKLQPRLSSISATGTPGTHTPPSYGLQESTSTDLSIPENGVSHFLGNTGSSSGGSATTNSVAQLHVALTNLQSPPSAHNNRKRSLSPNPSSTSAADAVRRAKSTGNLNNNSTGSTADSSKRSPPSYNIDPKATRRPGGNTAAKLELWRTQVNIESPQGLPPLAMRGAAGSLHPGMMGTEDRRIRLWERADSEMGYLRRFRNPVLEGVARALKATKGKGRKKAKSTDAERDRERERGRGKDSRPPSAAGRRSVRFEVGVDGAGDGSADRNPAEQEEIVEALLRRMWMGDGGGGCVPSLG